MSGYNPWKNSYKRRFKPKKEINDKINDPTVFSNHTEYRCLDSRILFPHLPQFIQAAFIDPGKVSCAIRIVRFYLQYNYIQLLWLGIHNFGVGMEQIITGVETELLPIKEKLQMCHHIVIESQFMKNEVNFRTFQHMISYIESFVRNVGMRAIIFEVDIALKTVFIGGPRNKNQYGGHEIKEWSKLKARYEMCKRMDYVSCSTLESCLDKQDEDLSDATCYEIAWWGYLSKIRHLFTDVTWLINVLS